MKIKHVPDCTVVQLADGRRGWKGVNTKSTKRNLILFAEGPATELKPDEEVEVLMYPAQLAVKYVKDLDIDEQHAVDHWMMNH